MCTIQFTTAQRVERSRGGAENKLRCTKLSCSANPEIHVQGPHRLMRLKITTVCFLIHFGSRHPGKHLRQAHDFTVMFEIVLVCPGRKREDDLLRRETLRHGVHATVISEPRAKVLTPHLRVVHLHPAGVRIRRADEDVSDDSRVFTSLDNTVCHDWWRRCR